MIPVRFFGKSDYSCFIPVIVIHYDNLCKFILEASSSLPGELEEVRKTIKQASLYRWDNNIFRFQILTGQEFVFHLSKTSINVWDYTRDTAVGVYGLTREELNRMNEECHKFTQGMKKCSSCHEWISIEENKTHRYFAGLYCQICWDNKYKAIEAKETYN